MKWPTLYKLDNKGKIRQWSIKVDYNDDWYYEQTHGTQGGKMQTTSTTIEYGKNEGKANETSPEEQCILEANALWTKQRDRKGYTETIPTEKPFGPMLAKSYDKDGKHIVFPCAVQPKLDGLRCIAKVNGDKVTLWSRQNKQFKVLEHLEKELILLPDGIYDGELYIHGVEFQKIVSGIKRDEPNELTPLIEYHIYDIINDKPYIERQTTLHSIFSNPLLKKFDEQKLAECTPKRFNKLIEVESIICRSKEELPELHAKFVKDGYEGIMLRNTKGLYKISGRSSDLQKYKLFLDEEFEIIGAKENKGKLEGTCVFTCKTKEGGIFDVMPEGSEEQRAEYWERWLDSDIVEGNLLTVKFFEWTTTKPPVPRFPIGKTIRNGY